MKRRYVFIYLFSLISLVNYNIKSVTASPPEGILYNMTATEVKEVVSEWFRNHGFFASQQFYSDQQINLVAEKQDECIHVTIQRHSPLAALVKIQPVQQSAYANALALRLYLDGYVQLPNQLPVEKPVPVPDVIRHFQQAVVCIFACTGANEIQLTGFVIDTKGFIVCTAHDLKVNQQVTVVMSDGHELFGRADKIDHLRDLALIHTQETLDTAIPVESGRSILQSREQIFAISCPNNGLTSITPGFLDGPPRHVRGMPLLQVQMIVHPGSSGSPVFDSQGRLTAVIKGRFRGTDAIGFLIPFESILEFLERY